MYCQPVSKIGKISVKSNYEIEWSIPDFLFYTEKDKNYDSPRFDSARSQWYFKMYPNGHSAFNSTGSVGLCLLREGGCSMVHQGANYSFGIKRADGVVEQMGDDFTWVFPKTENEDGAGTTVFVQRSELTSRESELVPSGIFTVTCSLWVKSNREISARTLSQDFLDMFTSKRGCDVTMKVKNEEFSVHKFVLVARSCVFAALFGEEGPNTDDIVLNIEDCDPAAFKDFLTYLYSGKAEILSRDPIEIYKMADKYGVKELKSDCLICIMCNLSLENVLETAAFAHEFPDNDVNVAAQRFFNKNCGEIVSTAAWKSFKESHPLIVSELLANTESWIALERH